MGEHQNLQHQIKTKFALSQQEMSRNKRIAALFKLIFKRASHAQVDQTSAALAYYEILSVFPMALLVINIIYKFQIKSTAVSNLTSQVVPKSILSTVKPVMHDLGMNASTTWLGIGAIVTLWAASLGIESLKAGFNRAYGVHTPNNYLISKIIAMLMTLTLIVLMISLMIFFSFGKAFLKWVTDQLGAGSFWLSTFEFWRWPVTILFLAISLVLLYYFIPSINMHFWTILPGTSFTTIGWLILSQAFSLYLQYFNGSFTAYGALAAFIIVLLWLFFNSVILILGAVINAIISEYYYGKLTNSPGKLYEFWKKLHRTK